MRAVRLSENCKGLRGKRILNPFSVSIILEKRNEKRKGREIMTIKKMTGTAVLTALLLAASAQPALADTVYVDCDVLRCRTSAEIRDDNISENLYQGEALERTGTQGEWTVIRRDGKTRYVSSVYLSEKKPSAGGAAAQGSSGKSSAASSQNPSGASSQQNTSGEAVGLSADWKYAEFSKINSGTATLYRTTASARKNRTVCVNAGHGTSGGSSVKTLCHPDGSPKVTGGTTGAGATSAVAVSSGMTFSDGTAESKVTLQMAKILKEKLLAAGYDVLMIRESDDVQLDNIARTVIANNRADCHIALHWDSTTSNKGAFYMSVPNVASYRAMEPVASHWQEHHRLGEALVSGLRRAGVKIFSGGSMEMDLTQTSYSTVPSVDIELGDKASDHSQATLSVLADGLLAGVNAFFSEN